MLQISVLCVAAFLLRHAVVIKCTGVDSYLNAADVSGRFTGVFVCVCVCVCVCVYIYIFLKVVVTRHQMLLSLMIAICRMSWRVVYSCAVFTDYHVYHVSCYPVSPCTMYRDTVLSPFTIYSDTVSSPCTMHSDTVLSYLPCIVIPCFPIYHVLWYRVIPITLDRDTVLFLFTIYRETQFCAFTMYSDTVQYVFTMYSDTVLSLLPCVVVVESVSLVR